jgi:hypothetical protein
MIDRWRPAGESEARVIAVEGSEGEEEVLFAALGHAGQLLETCSNQ